MVFNKEIQIWFHENKRDLPWRNTNNPYFIWISEVILQQTRVIQGIKYYNKFIKLFPTVISLANATEEEVLNAWQGLGYYSRARNLHYAAKQVVTNFEGEFPALYDNVRSLKGIGEYTSAAITSIAFGLPYAAVDGNVLRVLARLHNIHTPIDSSQGAKEFKILANKLLDNANPGIYNQAVMEFGALWCKPKNPDCKNCIFASHCAAYLDQTVDFLPFKAKKTKVSSRFFTFFYIPQADSLFLNKRLSEDIWKGLYELPLLETQNVASEKEIIKFVETEFEGAKFLKSDFHKVHILSHQRLHAVFYELTLKNTFQTTLYNKVKFSELKKFPISRLTEEFFEFKGLL